MGRRRRWGRELCYSWNAGFGGRRGRRRCYGRGVNAISGYAGGPDYSDLPAGSGGLSEQRIIVDTGGDSVLSDSGGGGGFFGNGGNGSGGSGGQSFLNGAAGGAGHDYNGAGGNGGFGGGGGGGEEFGGGGGGYTGGSVNFGGEGYLGPSAIKLIDVFGASLGNGQVDISARSRALTWAMLLLGFAGLGFAGYRRVKVI